MRARGGSRFPSALALSGLDPSGGAGLLADVRTLGRYRVHGLGVATCLTVQSSRGLVAAHPVDPEVFREQLRVVLRDERPSAIKIGLLPDAALVDVIADALAGARPGPIVLDPVASASAGGWQIDPAALLRARERLFPLCALLTPNLDELLLLAGAGDTETSARSLLAGGSGAVLVKGGHAAGPQVEDLLVTASGLERIRSPRIPGPGIHGTGCFLSSAIAALLALGRTLESAVRAAILDLRELRIRADPGPDGGGLARLPLFPD